MISGGGGGKQKSTAHGGGVVVPKEGQNKKVPHGTFIEFWVVPKKKSKFKKYHMVLFSSFGWSRKKIPNLKSTTWYFFRVLGGPDKKFQIKKVPHALYTPPKKVPNWNFPVLLRRFPSFTEVFWGLIKKYEKKVPVMGKGWSDPIFQRKSKKVPQKSTTF